MPEMISVEPRPVAGYVVVYRSSERPARPAAGRLDRSSIL